MKQGTELQIHRGKNRAGVSENTFRSNSIAIDIQQSNSASIALFLMTKDFIYATFSAFLIE